MLLPHKVKRTMIEMAKSFMARWVLTTDDTRHALDTERLCQVHEYFLAHVDAFGAHMRLPKGWRSGSVAR